MVATLYTWGYSGTDVESLERFARHVGALVADIRFSPHGNPPVWEGSALAQRFGRDYRWVAALGNVNYRRGGPIALNRPRQGVDTIVALLRERPVILLCGCADVATCHRRTAAELIVQSVGCPVEHLDGTPAEIQARIDTPFVDMGEAGEAARWVTR